MPIKKSAKKALKQSKKRALKNLKIKRETKDILKRAQKAIEAGDKKIEELVRIAAKAVDKAAQKRVFKKNKAARLKSRLMKKMNAAKSK